MPVDAIVSTARGEEGVGEEEGIIYRHIDKGVEVDG